MSQPPIIIYRLGSLGDTIVALPCFNAVSRRWPDRERLVLTNSPISVKAAPLLSVLGEGAGIVDGAIAYPVGTRSPKALWALARQLRALGADTLVYMMPNRGAVAAWRDWLFFKLAGFRRILAFPYSDDLRQNRIDAGGIEEPEAERLVRTFAEFGPIDLDDRASWDLHLSPAEKQVGEALAAPLAERPYFTVNMGGKAAEKDWGLDNWFALFGRLAATHGDHGVMVVGADVDSERAQKLLAAWPGVGVDACGKLSPRQSAAAMAKAALFIGHDSGPLHLAAASGVPVLGLFGDFNRPNKWHPIGSHVTVLHDMAGMSAIGVDAVEAAVRQSLTYQTSSDTVG
jgi:ADP-heptose:LPS heptosyltransferase